MKNSEKLLAAIGEANDKNIPDIFGDYADEPEEVFVSYEEKEKSRKSVFLKWGGLAAAVTVIAFVGMYAVHNLELYGSVFASKLTVIETNLNQILEGDESLWAAEPSELSDDNPWSSNMNITSMPIYKRSEKQTELSSEELAQKVTETAEKLGLTEPLFTSDGLGYLTESSGSPYSVTQCYEGAANVEITMYSDGSGIVKFGDHFSEGYNLFSEKFMRETLSKIGNNFNCIFGFESPAPKLVKNGRYREDGSFYRSYEIYDGGGDIRKQLLSFSCGSISVTFSDEALESLAFGSSGGFEFMGNYPVISYEEAVNALTENRSVTAVPFIKDDGSRRVITREDIGRGELVYCTAGSDYRIPFYKFYVKIGSIDKPLEMTEYGLYYVPAVGDEYLAWEYDRSLSTICWKYKYGNGGWSFGEHDLPVNDNPWNADMEISELPVYKNLAYAEWFTANSYFDEADLTDMAKKTAEKFGLSESDNINTEPSFIGKNEDILYSVKTVYSGEKYNMEEIGIEANTEGEIRVEFGRGYDQDGYRLPDGLRFDDEETLRDALEYTAESFKEVFGFENPAVDIESVARDDDGVIRFSELYIYDSSEDNVQNIINFRLNSVRVAGVEDRIRILWINNMLDSAVNMGNYPIISLERAKELLGEGKFYGSFDEHLVKNGKITEDIIFSGELVYRNGDNYFMPCYRFLVELEGEEKMYGACYVPAVEERYVVAE